MSASHHALLWALTAAAVLVVLVPIVGPLVTWGEMMRGPMLFGMYAGGLLWVLATFVVIAALVALIRREVKNA
jgi:hypothetical protein